MESDSLARAYHETRRQSLAACAPLKVEDYGLQAAVFASPPKWHLAHTSWFFETFLLKPFAPGYRPLEPLYEVLFNSYYNGIGEQHPRERRGLLSRPTIDEVIAYREHVDAAMLHLLGDTAHADAAVIRERVTLGIEHERQHQELFYTDLKYSLAANPLYPAYDEGALPSAEAPTTAGWVAGGDALVEIGFAGDGFCFDNELPRHRRFLEPFEMCERLVTNAEYLAFIEDDGYRRAELWLSDGWAMLQEQEWRAPLHWVERDGERLEYTLHGLQPWQPGRPVCHVSGYEAEAFARWSGARLPTEAEWESLAVSAPARGTEINANHLHPGAASSEGLSQQYDNCWQWTRSGYEPYPGFSAAAGAIGEYNGKFMSNQWVLRGGSCVTAPSQARPTYRNFFYPAERWQFSGIRLARSLEPAQESPA